MARLTDRPPTPPPGSPFLPPAQRPQLPPADPALRQRAAAGLVLAVLSVITMMWGANPQRLKYVAAVALVVALAGLVLAFSAIRAAKRAGTRRPRTAVAGAVIGVIATAVSGVVLGAFLLYPSQVTRYVNCMSGATNSASQNACWQQLQNSVGAGAR
ncbi:MAG: hypothetical protein ACRDNW_10415 [Trebonia sp.]